MSKLSADEIKRVKGMGFLQNRGTDNFSARIITVNGVINAEQAAVIAEAAKKFGNGQIAFTTRLTVEVVGVPYEQIEAFQEFIAPVGLYTGGTGGRVRPVVACKGTVCQYGLVDTQALAAEIHETFYKGWYDVKLPHKFKIGVGGCPNNCIKPDLNDFGIIGQKYLSYDEDLCNSCKKCPVSEVCPVKAATHDETGLLQIDREKCNNCGLCDGKCNFDALEVEKVGYKICLGGKWGKWIRKGSALEGLFTKEEVFDIIEKTLLIYREQGITGERFGSFVDRVGFENLAKQIEAGDVLDRKQEILDAQLHLVGGATC